MKNYLSFAEIDRQNTYFILFVHHVYLPKYSLDFKDYILKEKQLKFCKLNYAIKRLKLGHLSYFNSTAILQHCS